MKSLAILLVEDDTLTAADLRETLEAAGHRITAIARNREEALSTLRRRAPDLAILDIHLEGPADGITTARDLLSQHSMPIIYLTANSERPTFERALKTLPAAYLLKPFDPAELPLQVEVAYLQLVNQTQPGDPATAERIFLPVNKGIDQIVKADVVYLKAAGSYAHLLVRGDAEHRLLTMNLGYLSQFFSAPNFYRISRSLLINLDHVSRIENEVIFLNGHPVPLPIPEGSRAGLLKKIALVRTR